MMSEHRASFPVGVAALCGRRLRLARLGGAGNGVSIRAAGCVEADFSVAVDAVIQEFGKDGLVVDVEIRDASFARLSVASDIDRSKVEMGVDWRKHSPVQLAIGPVLDADDAVANKVCALFGRAETSTRFWRAAGTPKMICSHLPAAMTRALTHWGSLKRSPQSTACRFGYSSRTG